VNTLLHELLDKEIFSMSQTRPCSRADACRAAARLTNAPSADRLHIATIGMAPWPGFFKWMNWSVSSRQMRWPIQRVRSLRRHLGPNMSVGASLRGLCMMHYMLHCVGFRRAFRMAKVMGSVESQRFKYAPTALHLQSPDHGNGQGEKGKRHRKRRCKCRHRACGRAKGALLT
jgi:hypothetical protein